MKKDQYFFITDGTWFKQSSPFGFLFLRGDMNQDSQVKEYCENRKHWRYQGEVYFDCPYLFFLKPFD